MAMMTCWRQMPDWQSIPTSQTRWTTSASSTGDIKYGADWIKLMATGGVMDPISDYRVQE